MEEKQKNNTVTHANIYLGDRAANLHQHNTFEEESTLSQNSIGENLRTSVWIQKVHCNLKN